MNLVDYFYEEKYGCYPFETNENYKKTEKLLAYLFEAGVSMTEVLDFIEESPQTEYLSPDLLPDWLWNDSLLTKNKFYYHRLLRIRPKSSVVMTADGNIKKMPFYLEMRIKFSIEDLLNYYYLLFAIELPIRDYKKDKGALEFLLQKYKNIMIVEPVDFVLALLDNHKQKRTALVSSPLDASEGIAETYEALKTKVSEAKLKKADRVIWR